MVYLDELADTGIRQEQVIAVYIDQRRLHHRKVNDTLPVRLAHGANVNLLPPARRAVNSMLSNVPQHYAMREVHGRS